MRLARYYYEWCVFGTVVAMVVGAAAMWVIDEWACKSIDAIAPGYFAGRFSGYARHSTPEHDAPRKMGRSDLKVNSDIGGAIACASTTAILLSLRLGGVGWVVLANVIVLASAAVGGCVGGGIGYLVSHYSPDYLRGLYPVGGEPWFNPLHVGTGLGIARGLLVGLAAGAVGVLAVSWLRRRSLVVPQSTPPA
jgi:hypothetical protein